MTAQGKKMRRMEYVMTKLEDAITVDGIYTVHYFEYAKDFAYSGEVHNFWELVYADKKKSVCDCRSQ